MFDDLFKFIGELFEAERIGLHEPCFAGNEIDYLTKTIQSGYVSSVGEYVQLFEQAMAEYTGSRFAIATVNGTAALHAGLLASGVNPGDLVLTQSLTFVATANAIDYCGAAPVFIDVDEDTLGLSPKALKAWLDQHCVLREGVCYYQKTGQRISACLPMHTFGLPARIEEIKTICHDYHLPLVEDAAEALGSKSNGKSLGTFGHCGIFSFNGNKIITTGGGGMIVTDDEILARSLKHITTTAKEDHPWAYKHDRIGFNYRMPNLNAALGLAQLEQLDTFLDKKQRLTDKYKAFFETREWKFVTPIEGGNSNNWLNAVVLPTKEIRDQLLAQSHRNNIFLRPVWNPLHQLSLFDKSLRDGQKNTNYFSELIVNLPSSVVG